MTLVIYLPSQAQDYADKNYYLIDSLKLNDIVASEKEIIETNLVQFHAASNDIHKIKAINTIVETSWDSSVWPKYNKWMFDFTSKNLGEYSLNFDINKISSEKRELLRYLSYAINNFGVIQTEYGNLPKAFEYYNRSLLIREKLKDSIGLSESYTNIGALFSRQGKNTKAIEFSEKALTLSEKINDKQSIATILTNLGGYYLNIGDKEKGIECYNRGLKLSEELNNIVSVGVLLNNIAQFHISEGNLNEGLSYLNRSQKIAEKNGNRLLNTAILNNLASIYLKRGAILKAEITAEKAFRLAEEYRDSEGIESTASLLSSIYKKEKKWEKAFEMQGLHFTIKDSIRSTEIEENILRQQSVLDLNKKQQEIALLSVKNEVQELMLKKNRTSILLISVALIFALILAFIAYRGYKKKLYINKLLERQKSDISRKNEDKKNMLQEIHHRVKNNLQVVNSLLRMQSSKSSDEEVISAFKQTQSRVLSMAKLHEKMYQSGDLKRLNAKEHITMLVEEIVKNYTVGKKIKLNLAIDEVFIDSQTMMPLSLIINEMISNSLKYAFEGRNKGIITVKLSPTSASTNELYIADNGIGFITGKVTNGLGSKLIKSFTKQLNGTIKKVLANGTAFKLTFENAI